MNQEFKSFIETSCFEANFGTEYEMGEGSLDDSATKRNLARKLSFRESFDFCNENTDDSVSDYFFSAKRKLTDEIQIIDFGQKKPCLFFQNDKVQERELILQANQANQNHQQILVQAPNYENFEFNEYSQLSTTNTSSNRMEEEFENSPVFEEIPRETSLMEKLNGNITEASSPTNKENRFPSNRMLSLNTNLGFTRQTDSPTSCLVKSHSDPHGNFQSPSKRFNNSSLATCKNLRDPDLRTITAETLVELMHNSNGERYLIIDCRFEYEYQGGHIQGAINITSPEDLEELLIKNKHLLFQEDTLELLKRDWQSVLAIHKRQIHQLETEKQQKNSNLKPPILVFHCEFSQKRGPRALRTLRNLDRAINHANWPSLCYPEVYILENGYKNFHSKFPGFCDPINQYIRMVDKAYKSFYVEAKMNDRKVWKSKDAMKDSPKPMKIQRFKTMHCL